MGWPLPERCFSLLRRGLLILVPAAWCCGAQVEASQHGSAPRTTQAERQFGRNIREIRQPIQTRWWVIEGRISSGKTSVIQALENLDHPVIHEAARMLYEPIVALARGTTLPPEVAFEQMLAGGDIRFDVMSLMLRLHQEAFRHPGPNACCFFDAGIPAGGPFLRLSKRSDALVQKAAQLFRYAGVFMLDPLPRFAGEDPIRRDDGDEAERLAAELDADYRKLGYAPVPVPTFHPPGADPTDPVVIEQSVAARVQFILRHVSGNRADSVPPS